MFGPPGHAYVYFTYGMHFCVNVVCRPAGIARAVLLRAGRVVAGEHLARPGAAARRAATAWRRPQRAIPARDLARGPARLCQALAIDRAQNGADLCAPASELRLRPARPVSRTRPVRLRVASARTSLALLDSWRPPASAYKPRPRDGPAGACSAVADDPTVSA